MIEAPISEADAPQCPPDAAPPKRRCSPQEAEARAERHIQEVLARLAQGNRTPAPAAPSSEPLPEASAAVDIESGLFFPREPATLEQAGVSRFDVSELVLKTLLVRGSTSGRDLAEQVKLPFRLVEAVLAECRQEQCIVYKGSNAVNDYLYQLTSTGVDRARRLLNRCAYFGAAPVTLEDYVASVEAQSLKHQRPGLAELNRAMADLEVSPELRSQIAQAVHAGRGMFLYGSPGNGKSTLAERVTLAYGEHIWIPRAIGMGGEIIRMYDPAKHRLAPPDDRLRGCRIDARWVRILRPTLVVGGELTMAQLDVTLNPATGTCEAPLQLKSNCGTLVIDDFGRQRIRVDELFNRWIVPLEKRLDFLNLPSGRSIEVPFDQLLVFATNLAPRDLVDEAFLRRIPYKIDVPDPDQAEFRRLMRKGAEQTGLEYDEAAVDHLLAKHYQQADRPLRRCHPRDLLLQVLHYCQVHRLPLKLTPDAFDIAARNYFAIM